MSTTPRSESKVKKSEDTFLNENKSKIGGEGIYETSPFPFILYNWYRWYSWYTLIIPHICEIKEVYRLYHLYHFLKGARQGRYERES
jgi:hypothetical protein